MVPILQRFDECKRCFESSFPEGTCTSSSFVNEFSEPITLKEVKTGIKSLKNNTSVGYDCISNEMLKYSNV